MGDPLQASNAWAMGNVGLSTALRVDDVVDAYGDKDAGVTPGSLRGRLIRWSFGVGCVLAYLNHWPGGR